jgi:hypothetical protein
MRTLLNISPKSRKNEAENDKDNRVTRQMAAVF